SGVHVNVNVDEAGRHVQPRRVDDLQRLGGVDVRGNSRHLAVRNRQVANRADVVPGIDDVTAFQQKVVPLLGRHAHRGHDDTSRGEKDSGHDVIYSAAMTSISTSEFPGMPPAAAMVVRTGGSAPKRPWNISFMPA